MPEDMSLQQLQSYTGSSPKPPDFDAYWERALQELERQPLDYMLEPADFVSPLVECFHLYFIGVGGAKVHGKLVRPKHSTERGPALAMFHGYSCDSGDWFDKVSYAAHGFTVLVPWIAGGKAGCPRTTCRFRERRFADISSGGSTTRARIGSITAMYFWIPCRRCAF